MIHATVIGNLGSDAELRTTPGGKVVCNFRIAAKGRDKNAEATWVRCALWGARGERVAQYLEKGGRVAVSGTLTTSEYEGKIRLELDVSELELLGKKRQTQERDEPPPPPQRRRAPQQRNFADQGDDDGSIPF